LQFTVANPNPYSVSMTSVTYGTVTSSDQTNCPASNLTTAANGPLGTPISVPGSGSSGAVSVPSGVTLAVSAPSACQGVTFTVAVTLSGTQT
jgi:D-arabinose 1-dehydrogenase-like Zn-dependent alcohol dehydrogenase